MAFIDSEVASLAAVIDVDEKPFVGGLNRAKSAWDGFGNNLASTGNRLDSITSGIFERIGHRITDSLLRIPEAILKVGVDYEKGMNVFQAVTRASSDEMAKAAKVAQELGADMKLPATSAGDAALAMTELAKGGLTAAQSMDAARGVLELAAAATISEAKAAEITANALNTFSLQATEAGRVSDLLAAAANASSAEITDIALAMQQSGAAAASLKIPIDDLVAAIGEMANAGIKGSDAGTSLKVFMTRLAPETNKAAAAMKQLGIDAFDSSGKFVGLEAIIRQAAPALARMTDEQRQHAIQTAFGTDAMRAARIILEGGIDKFKQMEDAVNRSGAAQELAAAKTKGLGGAWEGLKSQLETVALSIFQKVAPSLESLTRGAASLIDGFGKLSPSTQSVFLQLGALALVSGPLLRAFSSISGGISGLITWLGNLRTNATTTLATLQGFANSAVLLLANVSQNFDDQMARVNKNPVLREWLDKLKSGAQSVKKEYRDLPDVVVGAMSSATSSVVSDFTKQHQVLDKTKAKVDETTAALPKLADRMKGAGGAAKAAKPMFDEFASGITGLSKAIDIIKPKLGDPNLFSPISKSAKASMEETKAAFKVGADAIESLFEAMGQKVKVTIERLAGLGKGAGPLLDAALGFQKLKEAIENLNFDRAAKGLAVLDDEIKLTGKTIEIAFNTFRGLSAQVVKDVEKVGFTFKVVFPDVSKAVSEAAASIDKDMRGIDKSIEESSDAWTAKFKKSMEEMSAAAPHWADETVKAAERVKSAIEGSVTLTVARARLDQKAAIDGMIADFERLAEQMGLSGTKFKNFVEANIRKTLEETGRFTKQQIDQMVEEWKKGIERLPGIWETVFGRLPSTVKGPINDVLKIIDTMPGKIGETLRKTQSEFEKWLNFIDNIFGLIHRIFDSFPESIGKAIEGIKGWFDKSKDAISSTKPVLEGFGSDWLGAWNNIASGAESGASRAVAAISGISTALTALGAAVGGGAGGALSGAGLGLQIGLAFGGIGAIIGAGIGAIVGFFGGGKSRHEKEMERQQEERGRLEIERLKKQIQKDAQEVVQAALQTMREAMQTLEQLADYTKVGRKHITRFFADLESVLKLFFDLSTKWGSDLLDKAKAFAKKMTPVIEMVGIAVQALSLLGSYLPVAESIIVEFFRDLESVVNKFGELAETIPNKLLKHAKKLANKLGPLADVIGPFVEGFAKLFGFKAIPQEAIDAFGESLALAMTKLGQIAEEIDRKMAKDAQRFAERAAAVVALIASGVEAFVKLVDFKAVTAEAFDALFEGFREAIKRMTEMVTSLDLEMLARAQAVAAMSLAIFESIKSAIESFNLLRDYKSVPVEAFESLVNDFREAIRALDKMIEFTATLQSKAEIFRDAMIGVRDTLQEGIDALRDVVRFAGAALGGIVQEQARGGGTTINPQTAAFRGGDFAVTHRYESAPSSAAATPVIEDRSIHIGDLSIPGDSQEARDFRDALDRLLRLRQAAHSY